MSLDLRGVLPPVPTIFANDALDERGFKANLERLAATGIAGCVVLGSNGEAALLDRAEKVELLRWAREILPANLPLVAGTGCESARQTLSLTQQAADAGANAALVLVPAFYNPGPANLERFFVEVADRAPIPVLMYNMPKYTGLNMAVDLIAALAKHPNIIGMKDSAGNIGQLAAIHDATPANFALLAGSDSVFFAAISQRLVHGAILALANIAPAECVALHQALATDQLAQARAIAGKILPVGRLIISELGVPGLKAALEMLGAAGGSPRLPLLPLSGTDYNRVKMALQQAKLL